MPRALKASAAQHLEGHRTARADVTIEDYVPIARYRFQIVRKCPQRNVTRAFDVSRVPFMRLTNINDQRVAHVSELRRCDLMRRRRTAESFVIDQRRHGR